MVAKKKKKTTKGKGKLTKSKSKSKSKLKSKSKSKAKAKKKTKKKLTTKERLIAACRIWDKATDKAMKGDYPMPHEIARFQNPYGSSKRIPLYARGDYDALECTILDDGKAEVTVGSSEGHTTHVDLKSKTLEYYDFAATRKKVMMEIFEFIGLKCIQSEGRVKCEGVTPRRLNNVFRVLAMPTSMDYRISHCYNRYPMNLCKERELEYFLKGPAGEK